ncbi:MAG: 3-hydroxyacyl-CoA dehydrogenase family protein [Verrucomicrobiota bacterium]
MTPEAESTSVAVVGQGLLGRSIAACFIGHGFSVVAIDRSDQTLTAARAAIAPMIDDLIERRGAPASLRSSWATRYLASTDFSRLRGCTFVVESVTEDATAKSAALAAIEAEVGPNVVIASNTSALPISQLQHGLLRPGRVVGMHWAEPAHATRFMELIRGDQTSAEAMEITTAMARRIGKDPCTCERDIPGFIVNRLAYAMYREAHYLLDAGVADADTIDRATRNALGLWATLCGPLRWMDLTGGPELYAQAMGPVLPSLSHATEVPVTMQRLAASGARGIRNGRGFYTYTPEEARHWEELLRQHAWRMTQLQADYFPLPAAPSS